MGTSEHERLIRKAMTARVDLIQSVNVPRVVGDEGYAALIESMADDRSAGAQRAYQQTLSEVLCESHSAQPAQSEFLRESTTSPQPPRS